MKTLDKIANAFGFVRQGEEKSLGTVIMSSLNMLNGASNRQDSENMEEYLKRYTDQAWVFACVSVIASKGAGVPIKIYRKVDGETEEVTGHPIQNIIETVNPFMSGYDLKESTLGFLGTTGNAYWLLDNFKRGVPTEIYPIEPQKVRVKVDSNAFITGYVYEPSPGVGGINLEPDVVLHFKTWNPLSPFYGISPLSASRDAADSMMFADRYNKNFFENSAQPGGILTTDNAIDQSTADRIAEAWRKRQGGVKNASRVAIMSSGLKWQTTAQTNNDMQFRELKRMTREDILATYRIPPIMVGVFDEANYSNAREQRKIFWNDTMIPWFRKIESVLNERFVKVWDSSVFAAFDLSGVNDLAEDKKLLAEEHEILTRSGVMTINEARAARKLAPVEWGDTWNSPNSLLPIEEHENPPPPFTSPAPGKPMGEDKPQTEEPEPEEEPIDAESPKAVNVALISDKSGPTETVETLTPAEPVETVDKGFLRRTARWNEFKSVADMLEKHWQDEVRKLFSAQRDEVLQNIADKWDSNARQARLDGFKTLKSAVDYIMFNDSSARKIWQALAKKLMLKTVKQGGEAEAEKYNLGKFEASPDVLKWIEEKAFKFADTVNAFTEEVLKNALQDAIKAGESAAEVSKRVADVFDMAEGYRTERIARTEVVSSLNAGAYESYKQSGVVAGIEWITARDEKVRDSHKIDGEKTELGKPFSNGLKFPGDPAGEAEDVINCRCNASPVKFKE